MPKTYLQIVQTACAELGLAQPSTVSSSTSTQIQQLGALVNADLIEIQQNYNWTALQSEFDVHVAPPFTTVGNISQGLYVVSGILTAPTPGDFNDDYNQDFNKPTSGQVGDFNNDYNSDFAHPIGGGINLPFFLANPQLFVISGAYIVSNTRVVSAIQTGGQLLVTMDQPATGSQIGATVVLQQDTYPGPPDFDRYQEQTWWDRTNHWALIGPDSPQIDQWHRSGIVAIGPRRHWRQIGYNGLTQTGGSLNNWRVWPPPGANDTPIDLVYEYISSNCVLSATGVPQPQFVLDTDFPILNDRMFVLGAKWRMWQIKGFDYAAMQQEYIDYVDRRFANDGGNKTLSLNSLRPNFLISSANVPDGNWVGPMSGGSSN